MACLTIHPELRLIVPLRSIEGVCANFEIASFAKDVKTQVNFPGLARELTKENFNVHPNYFQSKVKNRYRVNNYGNSLFIVCVALILPLVGAALCRPFKNITNTNALSALGRVLRPRPCYWR